MPMDNPNASRGFFSRWFHRLWWLLDTGRRAVVNLLFLALIVVLVVGWWRSGAPRLQDKTALVLNLKGSLVEQRAGSVRDRINGQLQGTAVDQVQLRDVLAVLDAAAKDPKIDRLVLVLDDFDRAGLADLREVGAAISRFKAAGKQVLAWGTSYDQRQYYLASRADTVYLDPMGMVTLEGFGRYRNYYKDVLDRVGVSANVIRVGTFKNAAEPYFANAPSPASLEAEGTLWNGLWATYTADVEQARKLPAGALAQGIAQLPALMDAAKGDAAQLAVQAKLVDALKTRDEFRQLVAERGAKDEKNHTFRQVSFNDYLATIKPPAASGDAIGVVVAEGEIVAGDAPAGTIGGRSTAELIRKARENPAIKAVVLRVNSPGGDAFGSELVRRELELTRAAGKPVVVSMGDLAASGGYWITMSSDEVVADPATITGSIGVFAMLPTADKLLDKLPVHTGGVTTTWLTGAYDPRRPLDPRFAGLVQRAIEHTYTDFITKAAAARKTTPDKIDAVAQGRVWTGAQAKDRGLVDKLGSFGDALKDAATRAKLPADTRVVYIEPEQGRLARLLSDLGVDSMLARVAAKLDMQLLPAGLPGAAAAQMQGELGWLSQMADRAHGGKPFMALTHCLCTAD